MIIYDLAALAISFAIEQLLAALTSDRACVLVVKNATDTTWTRNSDSLDDGEWKEPPDVRIPPQSTMICTAQSSSILGVHSAVEGELVYSTNDATVFAKFDNPILGSDSCDLDVKGAAQSRYHREHSCGSGDRPQMLYELFQVHFVDLPPVRGIPSLIQGTFGIRGNFELVCPLADGGLAHFFRDNDQELNWYQGATFAMELGSVEAVSMIQSNYYDAIIFPRPLGHLEVIAMVMRGADLVSGYTYHIWRPSLGQRLDWTNPWQIDNVHGLFGNLALIQSTFGENGNFELVAPLVVGGVGHFWRDNDHGGVWMATPGEFGGDRQPEAVTMIQSNYGVEFPSTHGHLEVVARGRDQLYHFWRDSLDFNWSQSSYIDVATEAAGNPVLIQSTFGSRGNFELVYPLAKGGLAHIWRDNDNGNRWIGPPTEFGQELGRVDAVTMIQSNYYDPGSLGPGHLEVIARSGDRLYFFWRTSSDFRWNGPYLMQLAYW